MHSNLQNPEGLPCNLQFYSYVSQSTINLNRCTYHNEAGGTVLKLLLDEQVLSDLQSERPQLWLLKYV